jgi:hypothetical protein
MNTTKFDTLKKGIQEIIDLIASKMARRPLTS